MRPDERQIIAIVAAIWSAMVGWDVAPDDEALALTSRRDVVISQVRISGAWTGSITLHCDLRLAREMAAVLFGICPGQITVEMIDDTSREMINMIGGHFKSLLPEPCHLSLPEGVVPPLVPPADPTATNHRGYGFRCGDRNFLVMVATNPADR